MFTKKTMTLMLCALTALQLSAMDESTNAKTLIRSYSSPDHIINETNHHVYASKFDSLLSNAKTDIPTCNKKLTTNDLQEEKNLAAETTGTFNSLKNKQLFKSFGYVVGCGVLGFYAFRWAQAAYLFEWSPGHRINLMIGEDFSKSFEKIFWFAPNNVISLLTGLGSIWSMTKSYNYLRMFNTTRQKAPHYQTEVQESINKLQSKDELN